MQEKIYLDNASTSFPKPPMVAKAVYDYMTTMGCSVNRGGYRGAYAVEKSVFDTRQAVCDLFGASDSSHVVFTRNVTEGLNHLLKGLLHPGDHVLVSAMEHNAVMRPLCQLGAKGVTFDRIPCDAQGNLMVEGLSELLGPQTRAVVMTHASNVCGTILPIAAVGEWCRRQGLIFIVDCAQTGGVFPIDMAAMHIDALAFTGHKGLLGPQGIGGYILTEPLVMACEPLVTGGTGSISDRETVPDFMPDRFEAGTPNVPGILGLGAALAWLKEQGIDTIRTHELALTEQFLQGIRALPFYGEGIRIVGRQDCKNRTGTVSIETPGLDLSEVAFRLDSDFGIMTRVGLHCAPNAHKTLGTYPTGTLRFSMGFANTEAQIATALEALATIVSQVHC